MIVCVRVAAQAWVRWTKCLRQRGLVIFNSARRRRSSSSTGGFEAASLMRLTMRRTIVLPIVSLETEASASRRTRRSGPPSLRTRRQDRTRLKTPAGACRPTPQTLPLARSRKRRPIWRRCGPQWRILTAARCGGPPLSLCSRTASPARGSCSWAKRPAERRIESDARSSEEQGNCWTACWAQSDWIDRWSTSPMSFLGGPRATELRRLRRPRPVCLLLSDRSTSPIRNTWFVLAHPRFARFSASREGFCAPGAHGSFIGARTAAKREPSQCSIRRSCSGSQRTSGLRGRTCERLQAPSKLRRLEAAGKTDRHSRVRFERFQWLAAPFPSRFPAPDCQGPVARRAAPLKGASWLFAPF
jgi:hypothetical protein